MDHLTNPSYSIDACVFDRTSTAVLSSSTLRRAGSKAVYERNFEEFNKGICLVWWVTAKGLGYSFGHG